LLEVIKLWVDADLAELYGVPTKALNQAVKRNKDRFPEDFMFQLSEQEKTEIVTNRDHLNKLISLPTFLVLSQLSSARLTYYLKV